MRAVFNFFANTFCGTGEMNVKMKIFVLTILTFLVLSNVFADQTSVERMIGENKGFLDFINVAVTNFGDAEKESLFDAYQTHFNADVSFLQSDYRRAFRDVYASEKKLSPIYYDVLSKYYLEDTKDLLDKIAPQVIKSKNAAARFYLTLGYRDRAIGRNSQIAGDAVVNRFYSEKIFKYAEGIKVCRRGMRFALLALFESRDIETKKSIFSKVLETERDGGNIFYNRFIGKTGDAFNQQLVLTFDEYEKVYQAELDQVNAVRKKNAETKGGVGAPFEALYEKRVEREVRFRRERIVAEYIRDGEFDSSKDIISKYADDLAYKLIMATIDIMAAKTTDTVDIDWNRVKAHHADNFTRLTRDSFIDSFASRLKVSDDLASPANGANTTTPVNGTQENAPQGGGTSSTTPAVPTGNNTTSTTTNTTQPK